MILNMLAPSTIFNTLCSGRRELLTPSSCPASDAAILSRSGPVVEPGAGRILIDTGNAPWNGTSDFGDSVLELSFPKLALRQSFTPTNQAQLNSSDADFPERLQALARQLRATLPKKRNKEVAFHRDAGYAIAQLGGCV